VDILAVASIHMFRARRQGYSASYAQCDRIEAFK